MSRSGSEGGSGTTTPGSKGARTPQRVQSLGMTRAASGDTTGSTDSPEWSDGTNSEDETAAPSSAAPSAGKRYFGRHVPADHMLVRGIEPRSAAPIVAERVSVHGRITPMEPDAQVQALNPKLKSSVGRIRSDGPIGRWIERREAWDARWPDDLQKWREIRAKDHAQAERQGFLTKTLQGEHPPPSALAGMADPELARQVGKSVDEPTAKATVPVLLWSQIASKRDAEAAKEEEEGEKKENPLKRIISRRSGEGEGEGNILTRVISRKTKEEPREDGGPSPTESELAMAAGVAEEEAKMANAGRPASSESAAVSGAALAWAGVAAGLGAGNNVDAAPHTLAPVEDHDEPTPLSRVSSAGSEYVLARESFDVAHEDDGIRQYVVTETITSDPDTYDEPTSTALPPAPANGVTASDHVHGPAKAPEVQAEGQVVTPSAQRPAVEGEPSRLSDTTAVDSSLAPTTPAANGSPSADGKPGPVAEKQLEAVSEKTQHDGNPAVGQKPARANASKGVSHEYADIKRKGLMSKLACC